MANKKKSKKDKSNLGAPTGNKNSQKGDEPKVHWMGVRYDVKELKIIQDALEKSGLTNSKFIIKGLLEFSEQYK